MVKNVLLRGRAASVSRSAATSTLLVASVAISACASLTCSISAALAYSSGDLELASLMLVRDEVEKTDRLLLDGDVANTRGRVKKLLRLEPRRQAAVAVAASRLPTTVGGEVASHVREAEFFLASVVEFDALDDLNNPTSSRLAELSTPEKARFAHRALSRAASELDSAIACFDRLTIVSAQSLVKPR